VDSVTNYCPSCNSSKSKSLLSQISVIVRCVQFIYMYRLLPSQHLSYRTVFFVCFCLLLQNIIIRIILCIFTIADLLPICQVENIAADIKDLRYTYFFQDRKYCQNKPNIMLQWRSLLDSYWVQFSIKTRLS
jgi:hypothetical protein